jgi:tetratricopeptide (TPR) repeat protein
VVLVLLIGIAVVAFLGTRAVAHSNEALRRRQAAAWFSAAQRASRDGHVETAVDGFRRAVSKDPDNKQYRLALAAALMASGLDSEAGRVLLALREAEPEDPETNLQLARVEARGPNTDAARRYYQNALAGLWRPEQAEERRRVRVELIEFLLAHEERARALSELLLVAANLPPDAPLQTHTGRMFLATGNPRLALDHLVQAVRLDPDDADALAGAGEAAFEIGDYRRALGYLDAASQQGAAVAELREVARLVVNVDPLAPRLRASERRRRLGVALQHVLPRLEMCFHDPSMRANAAMEHLRSEVRAFQSALDLPRRREPRDLVDDGVDLVYRVERAMEQSCGMPAAPLDRALLLIGRRHGLGEQ